ncbi:hypothetical protein ACWCQS_12360 [Streptomyces sp. NPDC002076]
MHLPEDAPEADMMNGLGNRESELVQRRIREEGVEPYDGSGRFVHAARAAGLRRVAPEAARGWERIRDRARDLADLLEER